MCTLTIRSLSIKHGICAEALCRVLKATTRKEREDAEKLYVETAASINQTLFKKLLESESNITEKPILPTPTVCNS